MAVKLALNSKEDYNLDQEVCVCVCVCVKIVHPFHMHEPAWRSSSLPAV